MRLLTRASKDVCSGVGGGGGGVGGGGGALLARFGRLVFLPLRYGVCREKRSSMKGGETRAGTRVVF